jgi:fibronectin type 3 domain-containing protein
MRTPARRLLAVLLIAALAPSCGGGGTKNALLGLPTSPKNLRVLFGEGLAMLTWDPPVSLGIRFEVQRSASPFTKVAENLSGNSFTDTGLTDGTTYTYTVLAVNSVGKSDPAPAVPGKPAVASAPPAQPTGLAAVAGDGIVTLTWTPTAGIASYTVQRGTAPGVYTTTVTGIQDIVYVDSTVANGTPYFYSILAVNSQGTSPVSSEVSATPVAPSTAPPAPTSLNASPAADRVKLSWSASANADSYTVRRGTVTGVYTQTFANITDTGFVDTSIVNGTTYFYAVAAENSFGTGVNSTEAMIATVAPTAPPVPTGLVATEGNGELSISWDTDPGAATYTLRRGTATGVYTQTFPGITGTLYKDSTVLNGTPYFYAVAAVNSAGTSANSTETSTTPIAPPLPPAAPSALNAVAGATQATLTWTAGTGATSYTIRRATVSGGPYTLIASDILVTTFIDPSLTPGSTYYYVTNSHNDGGNSGLSNEAAATLKAVVPTNLVATPGVNQVSLAWTASAGATSYNVKRSGVSGGPYTILGGPATNAFVDVTAVNGSTYFYVVSAVNAGGESANATEASATLKPSAPTALVATPGNAQVDLSWGASAGATSYNVKRSTTPGGPYTVVANPTAAAYTNTGLTNGTTYYFVVSALDGGGEGVDSSEVSAAPALPPPPAPPGGLSANPGDAQVSLLWLASTGATSYNVKRATVSGGPYTQVGAPTTVGFTAMGLTNNTTYYFIVTAVGVGGESAPSVEVSATPVPTPVPPVAPTGLGSVSGDTQIALSWTATAGATSYKVKRATVTGGPYTTMGTPTPPAYTDPGLTNGVAYFYVVSGVNVAGEGPNSAETSNLASAPPANLAAVSSNNNVALTWNASPGVASYKLKRATVSGGPYTTLSSPVGTNANDATAVNGTTYYYVVSSFYSALGGVQSVNSAEVSAIPLAAPTLPSATPGNTQVTLSWTGSTGAITYAVKRSLTTGGPYTTVATPAAAPFTDTGLSNGTTYFYVISALNGANASANSAEVSSIPIAPPGGVTAVAGTSTVQLTWTASTGATSYNIKRATVNGGPYTQVGNVGGTSYPDSSLTNGTTYYYVLSALNPSGEGGDSPQVMATPIAQPSGVAAVRGAGQVALSWTASAGATSYKVRRSLVSGGPYTVVGTPTPAIFTNSGLTNGTLYYFVISGVNATGESVLSAEASGTPLAPPTGVSATPGDTQATVSWSAAAGAVSYTVYYGTSPGGPYGFSAGGTVSTSLPVTGLTDGTTYYFIVRSADAFGESGNSVEVSAKPEPPAPPPPTGVRISGYNGQANLTWNSAAGATSYTVYRATAPGVTKANYGSLPGGTQVTGAASPFTAPGLTNGTTYYFVVTSVGPGGEGSESSQVSISPLPLTPISGLIAADQALTTGTNYIVTGNLLVNAGVTLTVQPGVTVYVQKDLTIQVDGALIAAGTVGSPIRFTSADSPGAPGDWGTIYFRDSSVDASYDGGGNYLAGSMLQYCTVEYAGSTAASALGAVRVQNCGPFFDHCTFQKNAVVGLYAMRGAPSGAMVVTNSTFDSNTGAAGNNAGGFDLQSFNVEEIITLKGCTFTNNTGNCGGLSFSGSNSNHITIQNNLFTGNTALGSGGGAYITFAPTSDVTSSSTITGNTFKSNHSNSDAGGVYINLGGVPPNEVDALNNTITDNTAGNNGGGAVLSGNSVLSFCYNIVARNTAVAGAGGLSSIGTQICSNLIFKNSAGSAGGAYINGTGQWGPIQGNQIADNTSSSTEGGLYLNSDGIVSCSVVRNQSQDVSALNYAGGNSMMCSFNVFTGNNATNPTNTKTIWNSNPAVQTSITPGYTTNNIFLNTATYALANNNAVGSNTVDATNNYWGVATLPEVSALILDFLDNSALGVVNPSPFSATIRTNCSVSPPTGVVATPSAGKIAVSWGGNPEANIAGYRVYWGQTSGFPYANTMDAGIAPNATLNGLSSGTWYVAVTAYNTSYSPSNTHAGNTLVLDNQVFGLESYFSVEMQVTVP